MWNDEQLQSILDFSSEKNSREELRKSLSLTPENIVQELRENLSAAIDAWDLERVSDVRWAAFILEVDMRSYVDLVARLFGADIHRHWVHEELVRALQDLADPAGIPILREAIALKPKIGWEDDYVESRSFFQRCSHALRAIDTPESLALIEECSYSNNSPLRDEALYRLLKIESGAEKPLANAGEGTAHGTPDAAKHEIKKSLWDLVYVLSETRGLENLRLVHSLIIEACLLYSARCGYDVYSELLAVVEAPGSSFADVAYRERWFARLYLFLSVNSRHPIKPPEDRDNLQETPFYEICAMLFHSGAESAEVYSVFQRTVANVKHRALPAIYLQNAHVLNEGYVIADGIER